MYVNPEEMEMMERQEEQARSALAEARERNEMVDGVLPDEHHHLIHKLEEEWKHALDRLERARKGKQDRE